MDCMMPVMDGFEATKQIKSMTNEWGVKLGSVIIGISAMTEEKEINRWFGYGIDYFCKFYSHFNIYL
jgi:two-component system sensor histidine kinase BarA